MLSREEAQEQLSQYRRADGAEAQVRRISGLRGVIGRAGRALPCLQLLHGKRPDLSMDEIGRVIDAASPRARRKLFAAVSPALADIIDPCWDALRADPYGQGHLRRAFRAPSSPEASHGARAGWLNDVAWTTAHYEQPAEWFAVWTGYLGGSTAIGRLLGLAIDQGDQAVLDTLIAICRGEHPVGSMGHHVPAALLSSSEPAAWEEVERLLLAAQRQEGLRQVILEAVDLAHPNAFSRILRLIVEQDLTRFSSVIRAVGVWLGEPFEARDRRLVEGLLQTLIRCLGDAGERAAAADADGADEAFLGLWAIAFHDAPAAAARAAAMLGDASADRRLAAARLLSALQLPAAQAALLTALSDSDLPVTAIAVQATGMAGGDARYEPLRGLLERLPADITVPIGIWKPAEITLSRSDVADAVVHSLGSRAPTAVRDLLTQMSPHGRASYATLLARTPRRYRAELLEALSDRAEHVRRIAFRALQDGPRLDSEEAAGVESLLRRRGADVRRGAIALLLRQRDSDALASVRRLLDGTAEQRRAGAEVARELVAARRSAARAQQLVDEAAGRGDVAGADRAAVTAAGARKPAQPSAPPGPEASRLQGAAELDHLVDHAARTPAVQPTARVEVGSWAGESAAMLRSLDAWLAEHRDVEITVSSLGGTQVELVSNLGAIRPPRDDEPWQAQRERMPLLELIDPWWERAGGHESANRRVTLSAPTARAAASLRRHPQVPGHDPTRHMPSWLVELLGRATAAQQLADLQYGPVAFGLLRWLAARQLTRDGIEALLEAAEAVLAAVPRKAIDRLPTAQQAIDGGRSVRALAEWRESELFAWYDAAVSLEAVRPDVWSAEQRGRLWRIARWVDEPTGLYVPSPETRDKLAHRHGWMVSRRLDVPRRPPRRRAPVRLAVRAVEDGVATHADFIDLLVSERVMRDTEGIGPHGSARHPLSELTRRRRPGWLADHRWADKLVAEVRQQIVDIEAGRGELSTPVTDAAFQLRGVEGAEVVLRLLAGLGAQRFVRGYIWRGDSKPEVFSKLIRVCFPAAGDTAEAFAEEARRHGLRQPRLVELAVYAPQWAPFVEHAIGWDGLADAIHWLHAHTKDDRWSVDDDVRAEWVAETHQRTPLSAEDLVSGAVDVAWFERTRAALGDERFDKLLKAAKYASSSGGHKRAELFASALRGKATRDALSQRMADKRHQDSVRALGLLPLPDDPEARKAEVLDRYQQLQAWGEGIRAFGQQRRASESLALRIAMENLARTAGYRDPQRLQWSMEAEAVRDLAAGPITVSEGDATVSLSVSADGAPQLEIRRGDRALKSVPKALRGHEGVAALKERASALRAQSRRMRVSLEEAAVRGDRFSSTELGELLAHPLLAPMLSRLLVVTDEGLLGLPRADGSRLAGAGGAEQRTDGSPLRIAHPVDLLESGVWHDWQRACFTQRVRQPFKQVFRELYLLTGAERGGVARSERYAGHQIQPKQAAALLGARGWVVDRDAGAIRTYHDEKLTAAVDLLGVWGTPGEVEDMTLGTVSFAPVGQYHPMPLEDVPPRVFSEAMRDVDLVVSVAHAGGVDPEASASTVQMRAALVSETAEMLSLDNVELTDHHALIRGTLGSYSIHLGSGTVHRRPGNAVCIIPVSSQHRGRLFLPFADDDPRTAEIVSKTVLLARDDKIQDPTILAQLS